MLATTIDQTEWTLMIGSVVLAVLILAVLVVKFGTLRGTTMLAPWCWAFAAVFDVALSEVILTVSGRSSGVSWHEPLNFVIATMTFCPQMALLGAKRPQHVAWQFVVLTLWAILVLPAFEVMVIRPGQPLDVHGVRSWFLALLILVGAANSLPTRFWLSALLVAIGQTFLLWKHLPIVEGDFGTRGIWLAMPVFLIAVGSAARSKPIRRTTDHPLDRVWMDFRDWFGALWGLRVVERVNSAADMYGWRFRLTWQGFEAVEKSAKPVIPAADIEVLETAMTNVLRRFVSPEWIAKRMRESVN